MLNVAVIARFIHWQWSRHGPRNDQTNYGDLTRYIEYNNFEVNPEPGLLGIRYALSGLMPRSAGHICTSIKEYLRTDSRISCIRELQEVLSEEAYSAIGSAVHVSLATWYKDYRPFDRGRMQICPESNDTC